MAAEAAFYVACGVGLCCLWVAFWEHVLPRVILLAIGLLLRLGIVD